MRHLHFKKIKELEDKVTERADFQISVCMASEAPLVKPEPDFQLPVFMFWSELDFLVSSAAPCGMVEDQPLWWSLWNGSHGANVWICGLHKSLLHWRSSMRLEVVTESVQHCPGKGHLNCALSVLANKVSLLGGEPQTPQVYLTW